jgi:nascent polypeptide-associated complex subunit alpha
MMKQMGIEQKDIAGVNEVIFRFADKEWVVTDPQVVMIKQSGVESFQVSGTRSERGLTGSEPLETEEEVVKEIEVPMEDAALVASQTGVDIEVAVQALKDSGGDLAAAILKLRHN